MKLKKFNFADTDVIDIYIRIEKKAPDRFSEESLRIIELIPEKGVFAISGITKGTETAAIQSYLFLKEMWAKEAAQEWAYRVDETGELTNELDGGKLIISKVIDLLNDFQNLLSSEEPETSEFGQLREIKGIEIFQTGKHNGDQYTLEDLTDMEKNFPVFKNTLQPFVKLGHNSEQTLLAKDGLPAAGWIKNIYVKGEKLLADIVDIPNKVYELIKNRAYKRVSSEIYWNLKDEGGRIYKRVLKAIALLGGDTPAVGTLADIQALYSKREIPEPKNAKTKIYEFAISKPKETKHMDLDAIKAKLTESENQLLAQEKKYMQEKQDKEVMEKELKKVTDSFRKIYKEKIDQEIEVKVNTLINNKKILPAQKDIVKTLYNMQNEIKLYKKEDKQEDLLTKFFETNKDVVDTSEKTKDEQPVDDKEKEANLSKKIKDSKLYSDAADAYLQGEQ